MTTTSKEAIAIVHGLSQAEVAYDTALNLGRGLKAHDRNLRKARLDAFVAMVGREPSPEEEQELLWGDA